VTHDLRESAYLASRICVMSSRPGRIIEDTSVNFARPRTLESSYAPAFGSLVQQLRMRIAEARAEGDAKARTKAAVSAVEGVMP
jgi:NitT/TauT family transport system ATP-binding protein